MRKGILTSLYLVLGVTLAGCVIVVSDDAHARDRGSDHDTASVNSDLSINPHSKIGDLSSVNGALSLGDGSRAGELSTVNGAIRIGDSCQLDSINTVNGHIGAGHDLVVRGDIHSVNGRIELEPGTTVSGDLEFVNGRVRLNGVTVHGWIRGVNGALDTGSGSRLHGGIVYKRPHGISVHGKPRVVIGPHTVVEGPMIFKRPVDLYVHETATIGKVEGAEPKRYSGDAP